MLTLIGDPAEHIDPLALDAVLGELTGDALPRRGFAGAGRFQQ